MATLEDIYNQALGDEGERKALAQAMPDDQALAAFLGQRGCVATAEEARAFLDERLSRTGELALEELALVSGGSCGGSVTCDTCGSGNTEQLSSGSHVDVYRCNNCGAKFNIVWGR